MIQVPVRDFEFSGQGNYRHKLDRRDLFQIVHPWATSKAGDFGRMEARVTIPPEAEPPFALVLHVMDSNHTGSEPPVDWINRDVRVGHRFKQALINGEVVWEEDTCLDEVSRHRVVDVTDRVQAGETFSLAFRL